MTTETLPAISNLSQEARTSLRSIHRLSDKLNEQPQSILFGTKAKQPVRASRASIAKQAATNDSHN